MRFLQNTSLFNYYRLVASLRAPKSWNNRLTDTD